MSSPEFADGNIIFDTDLNVIGAAIAGDGVLSGWTPSAHSPANMSVDIALGVGYVGSSKKETSETTNVAISAAHGSLPRRDIIIWDTSEGALAAVDGTPEAVLPYGEDDFKNMKAPKPPDLPASDDILIAEIYVPSGTSAINAAKIWDKRFLLTQVREESQVPNLPASKVTSGEFATARIPSLATSKVTSGQFPLDRMPRAASGVLTGKGAGVNPAYEAAYGGLAFFGDGSDGDVTISTNTDLARDMFYNTLTVNEGITLSTKGYRIFVKGTLTNNGSIKNNGGDGGDGGVSDGGAGGTAASAGSLGGSGVGGKGAGSGGEYTGGGGGGGGGILVIVAKTVVNNGAIEVNGGNGGDGRIEASAGGTAFAAGSSVTDSLGGNGGAGGATGGAAGSATAPPANDGGFRSIPFAIQLREFVTSVLIKGGAGGGGGNSTAGSPGGAGGGGGGGCLVLVYCSYSGEGTKTASAGAAGTGTGGAAGAAGTVIELANA